MFPLPVHIYFEIAALSISLFFFKRLCKSKFYVLPFFLAFIVLVEFYGRYLNRVAHRNNAWLYSISVPIEYITYFFLFYVNYTRKIWKKVALFFILGLITYVAFNLIFVQSLQVFDFNILKIGNFCIIILCCLYFLDLINIDVQVNLLREPMFWLATGLFLFNAGELLYSLFSDYINQYSDRTIINIFVSINNRLIWVLYTCIIISILCISRRYRRI